MPELPEVTTTVQGIKKECVGFTIKEVWSDLPVKNPSRKDFYETIKYEPYFKKFVQKVKNQKIVGATRRGKNILIELTDQTIILVHMKMTGHMMVGKYDYDKKKNSWHVHSKEKNEALRDPFNRFIHLVFTLKKGSVERQLVLSDTRKFAKIALLDEKSKEEHFKSHGPEPINPDISFKDFVETLDKAPANNRPIKSLLMDTRTIAGIGNIYSDEMLFRAGVHPESKWRNIPLSIRKLMHTSMILVLKKGIDFGGDSMSDYRNIYGEKGKFQNAHLAYKKTGKPCSKKGPSNKLRTSCPGIIQRKTIGGRSAHFCPVHQKLYK